jgi:hypothetical protein
METSVASQKKVKIVLGSLKPFPNNIEHFHIEHFRHETSAACSVKNHKLFEGLSPSSYDLAERS